MDSKKARNFDDLRDRVRCYRRDLFGRNSYRVDGSSVVQKGRSLIRGTSFIVSGESNVVGLGDLSSLEGCRVRISGDRNRIRINSRAYLRQVDIVIEGDDNTITIGENTRIYQGVLLAAMEGTALSIGAQCMIASDCQLRTGDSHSVTDLHGRRLNPAEDIIIDDHVWCGTRVLCLAGSVIPRDSIIGAGALVNRRFSERNVVVAGVPARVVKRGVDWCAERV